VNSLSAIALLGIFVPCAAITWMAGMALSRATNALDARFKLGSALGGLVLLGFATSLPEIAIVVAGALNQHLDIVIGNLIGGIAIQTALLALLDARAPARDSLTFLVGSLTLVLEAATVVAVVVIALGGTQLPTSVNLIGISPASAAMAAAWVLGLVAVNRMRRGEPWKAIAPGSKPGRQARHERHPRQPHPFSGRSTGLVVGVFAAGSVATLGAGWALEESGNALASHLGLTSGIFGATVLALVTALPGISTGFAAIKLGDYALSMSEMFGGNAFAPALFIVADVLAGGPVLPHARPADLWMAALGIAMTAVFIVSIIVRPRRTVLRMGFDSRLVVVIYVLAVLGLLAIPGGA